MTAPSVRELISDLCLSWKDLQEVSDEDKEPLLDALDAVPADPVYDLLSALDRAESMDDVRRALSDYENPKFPSADACLSLYLSAMRRTETRPD